MAARACQAQEAADAKTHLGHADVALCGSSLEGLKSRKDILPTTAT